MRGEKCKYLKKKCCLLDSIDIIQNMNKQDAVIKIPPDRHVLYLFLMLIPRHNNGIYSTRNF